MGEKPVDFIGLKLVFSDQVRQRAFNGGGDDLPVEQLDILLDQKTVAGQCLFEG